MNFLQSILSCLASSQSLQELDVWCDASGVFSGCATHTCICTFLHTYKHHTYLMPTKRVCACSDVFLYSTSVTIFLPVVQPAHTYAHTHTRTVHSQYVYWHSFCLFTVHVAVINCPSPTAGAGDVVAAALPNLKCLRKVTMNDMNPAPVLQTVGLCEKLQEVSVMSPNHCEVGMRCTYRWM